MAKKKNNWWKGVLATLVFGAALYGLISYQKPLVRLYYKAYRQIRKRLVKPITASIRAIEYPEGYYLHGIDVSHFQDNINWKYLKTCDKLGDTIEFKFAYMKATEGEWKEDRDYSGNWSDAHESHTICGAYHYYLADKDPVKQAQNFCTSVTLSKGDLPPVIDIEDTRGKTKTEIVIDIKIFADILERKYHVRPIIYSNISFIEDYLSDDFEDYYFWVAHYYQQDLKIAEEIHWLFWQHSDKAQLIGSNQPVDVNVFNGNILELRSILIQ